MRKGRSEGEGRSEGGKRGKEGRREGVREGRGFLVEAYYSCPYLFMVLRGFLVEAAADRDGGLEAAADREGGLEGRTCSAPASPHALFL